MKNEKEITTHHEYDGIRENDNPMPTWWIWSFFITIIFGAIYFLHLESGTGEDSFAEYKRLRAEHDSYFAQQKKSEPASEAQFSELLAKYTDHDVAASTYQKVCQACHADQLQGLIGPNLLDSYWIHGKGQPEEIYKAIYDGFVEKGMPAWGQILKENEVYAIVAFILSKKGTNVAGAKAPQGENYPEYLK